MAACHVRASGGTAHRGPPGAGQARQGAGGESPPGDGRDHAGTPRSDALIPALDEGQLAACARSGASGTGYRPTRTCGGRHCRSTRPWASTPRPAALADLGAIEQAHKDEVIGQYDAAVIGKEDGKPHVVKRMDRPHIRVSPRVVRRRRRDSAPQGAP